MQPAEKSARHGRKGAWAYRCNISKETRLDHVPLQGGEWVRRWVSGQLSEQVGPFLPITRPAALERTLCRPLGGQLLLEHRVPVHTSSSTTARQAHLQLPQVGGQATPKVRVTRCVVVHSCCRLQLPAGWAGGAANGEARLAKAKQYARQWRQ